MRLDCRQRKAMLLTSVLRRQNVDFAGAGVPSGTPPFNGARYLDTTTGVVYLGRNVLNFNNSYISTPTITGVRKINLQFWHNDPAPTFSRTLFSGSGTPVGLQSLVARNATSGNLICSTASQIQLNGTTIANNTTPAPQSAWNSLIVDYPSGAEVVVIGRRASDGGAFYLNGRIANVQILGAGDVLLASYAINEGAGTTIIDSVSGQNGTLTLGSGSWQLDWVPQN